ncbi:MAG TPA: pullulanase-type alpha-1,6-glucosidase, partial [Propionibacteriaceae bacterium]|nr:pullulanase-type alpha-1,6-glucosidase [Propionibacteriaceae bacterium]
MKINDQRAIWVDRHTMAWPTQSLPPELTATGVAPADREWRLTWSVDADIEVDATSVGGPASHSVTLRPDFRGLGSTTVGAHPQLAGYLALTVPEPASGQVAHLLTCELVVSQHTSDKVLDATGVQTALVLDTEFSSAARTQEFGVQMGPLNTSFRVWAPTARDVGLLIWPSGGHPRPQEHPMTPDASGSWSVAIPTEAALDAEYLFRVRVYAPSTGRIEVNLVTDPYSQALTTNSQRSVVANLDDPRWAPEVWRESAAPALAHPVDQGLYELHVRDFSISDELVPEEHRGTYLAFGDAGHGRAHLHALAEAGLTSIELLPTFDFATVDEDASTWVAIDGLRELPPDSALQQRIVMGSARGNPFNWGYDPFHWMAPEGSYTTAGGARGAERSAQFRTMVGHLHQLGLRVVLDQVFNHTAASGQHPHSVLDRIVPGYYHRLDARGVVYSSTCCANVATERPMVERLMVDACVHWVRAYRVDGFRFDLMGHSSFANLLAVREALDALTLDRDGVDGRRVTLHGEGWNFGEVADHRLFRQAAQGSLAGSGIATFSDRLRDAVRGGGPMSADPRLQGFGSGAFTAPNGVPANRTRKLLDHATDLLALGLAGNLASFQLRCSDGVTRRGDKLTYNTASAGYASEPEEIVNYVDAHDNETLWDALVMKLAPGTSMAERVRMNTLCLATATLAQSPFLWHAGTDLLRSKSLDRNSFNHGDWFNRLDWTGADNGFGRGLPPEGDNHHHWRHQSRLLKRSDLKPSPADV